MNSIQKLMVAIVLLLTVTQSYAQIKNEKTAIVKIYGNCGMCKSTIEKAGNENKTAIVNWNKDTKMATLKYDATKTNPDEILKRVAAAGYESDKFTASETAYNNLHSCCQYDKPVNTAEFSCCKKTKDSCCIVNRTKGCKEISSKSSGSEKAKDNCCKLNGAKRCSDSSSKI